jgi:hypothetical protein
VDRLGIIWKELEQQCRAINCFEFEYYWEMMDEFWSPWYIEADGHSLKFSLYDISNGDLKELVDQGYLEIIKVYTEAEMKGDNDRIRYRIKPGPYAEPVWASQPDTPTKV